MARNKEDIRKAVLEAFKNFHETHTVCRAPGCMTGFVALDPNDIDSYTQEPRRSPCPECKGKAFVHIQLELPL